MSQFEEKPLNCAPLPELERLLRQTLRITIKDGRIFLGSFAGTDKQLNILLANTDEFRLTPPESANPNGRFVGLVMIPRSLVVKIEAHNKGKSDGFYEPDEYT